MTLARRRDTGATSSIVVTTIIMNVNWILFGLILIEKIDAKDDTVIEECR